VVTIPYDKVYLGGGGNHCSTAPLIATRSDENALEGTQCQPEDLMASRAAARRATCGARGVRRALRPGEDADR
jgi:hypothetical protein